MICLILLARMVANAQLNFFNYAENGYLSPSQALNSLSELRNYRENVRIPSLAEDEIVDNNAYFKISYKKSNNVSEPGLFDIGYTKNNGAPPDFAKEVTAYYNLFIVDDDENSIITETINSKDKNGAYFFVKGSDRISILIRSMPKGDRYLGNIRINNLTDAQMKAFAKDFIQKMKFK